MLCHKLSDVAKMTKELKALPIFLCISYEVFEVCCCLVTIAICTSTKTNEARRGLHGLFCSGNRLVAQIA